MQTLKLGLVLVVDERVRLGYETVRQRQRIVELVVTCLRSYLHF